MTVEEGTVATVYGGRGSEKEECHGAVALYRRHLVFIFEGRGVGSGGVYRSSIGCSCFLSLSPVGLEVVSILASLSLSLGGWYRIYRECRGRSRQPTPVSFCQLKCYTVSTYVLSKDNDISITR